MNWIIITVIIVLVSACSTGVPEKHKKQVREQSKLSINIYGNGPEIVIDFKEGEAFYYPLIAVWLENTSGDYIQTLYVAKSVATGIFEYGRQENNKWVKASKRAPQTLPYWAHKRGVKAADGLFIPDENTTVPDAYSGATPVTGFILTSKADGKLPDRFNVILEINQNWDWNKYWTNDKYPDDENYKWSCQPALVYKAEINLSDLKNNYIMKPIGHSHYSGKTGELFTDLSTLTTALQIADSIIVKIK